MELIQISLAVAALFCSLVAGFLFSFAVVVMPGIRALGDLGFLQAFKAIDGVIQNNQSVFIIVWAGSAIAAIVAGAAALWQLDGVARVLVIAAAAVYIVGVQVPTIAVNVPLNNALQSADLESLSEPEIKVARESFEGPWIRWNWIRTVVATVVSAIFIAVCLRI